ncbi:TatD family hydrolase [Clostridioides difficile]|uniref:TatD family hydrolase n=1 Tax=Clostridioides difficile TaxID=1496 RepID=UPI0010334F6E|nr:TatD family hydrolase [Clostridioides difficile]
MLFDSHAHLNDESFDEDRDELIGSLKDKGVDLVVNPGADIETSITAIELAKKYDFIYSAVGVHPHDVSKLDDTAIETLRKLATENEKEEWFKKQIELANELKLPIIIHDRDAHGDTFEIIKNTKNPEIGCVLHCYSGNVELAREYVKMGCYISIPGTVTFKNNKKTREVVREIPLERLFIETDSPYMSPEPHRGKRNNPSQVSFVADKIAQEKGISYEEVCRATKENAKKFFNIK